MTSSITYSVVTLTIDGVTCNIIFTTIMDIQNVNIRVSVQIRVKENSLALFKMAESLCRL